MDANWIARAFADEIVAERARQHMTARALQEAVGEGLSSSAYQKYFVQQTRPIPSDVQLAVCSALGVRVSEMWARAEAEAPRLAARHDPITAELEAGLSPRARRALDQARAELGGTPPTDHPQASSEGSRRTA